jgi:alpha,alpha-trehalose phosphorylase
VNILARNNRTSMDELLVDETIFSVANGYLGTRGTFAEGYGTKKQYHQTYFNGVYDYYSYHYEENLTGFPQQGQKFVNLLDGTSIEFMIEDVSINLSEMTLKKLERQYDLDKGYTNRVAHYSYHQWDFILTEKRLVSSTHKFVITMDVTIESPNYEGELKVCSYLRPSKRWTTTDNDPRINQSEHAQLLGVQQMVESNTIITKTSTSEIYVASAIVHNRQLQTTALDEQTICASEIVQLSPDTPYHLTKHIIHTSSLYDEQYIEQLEALIQYFSSLSFAELSKTEETQSTLFWHNSGVLFPENQELEALLRYNIYQLNKQGGEDPKHNISAKGLSGEGYEGHYFWDTEIYMIPYFILTNPNKAKQLLLYRYERLNEARQEARNLGYEKGAKIPWRTINGAETSPYYPAGSAQFHINSDVAYALIKYVEATHDISFLVEYGFELLIETARFLVEAVHFHRSHYHLYGVTGPDEYTTVVNDNFYTNVMLQYHFKKVSEWYYKYENELSNVIERLRVTNREILHIQDVSTRIHIPYDEANGIHLQDNDFLEKPRLDLDMIPAENFPLLLHYHPLYLYKHQVCKQADTILAYMLLDHFDRDVISRTFDYYDPITTHDSSLSKCIYSIIAFQLDKLDLAQSYFQRVLETDISNIHKNTKDGLHVANLGGSYLAFVYGLVGLRIHEDHVKLHPRVTNDIKVYSLPFVYRNHHITVTVDEHVTITTTAPIPVDIYGTMVVVDGTYQTRLEK